jgi:hypothetical protein
MKVGSWALVQIMGYVEDDKIFSTLMFMKTRFHNQLCEHLDLVVRMFAQPFYIVDTFPYDNAITAWIDEKEKKGSFGLMFYEK